jgi:acetyltransferase-like isoleucine patch superfamily enzyme
MNRFLSGPELAAMGFAYVGTSVRIDRQAVFINPARVALGDHSRVDAFSLISAGPEGVQIGRYVHLGAGCQIFGGGGEVLLEDFSGLSGRATVYTSSVSFRDLGVNLTINTTITERLSTLREGPVILRRHSGVGCGSVVLPGVEMDYGSFAGALTLVRHSVPAGVVICGNPPTVVARRDRAELELLEAEFFAREWPPADA